MHRIPTQPGGWSPSPGDIQQTPAPIVLLTAAATDIQTLAQAVAHLPPHFPALRVCNWLNLSTPYAIDTYIDQTLSQAQIIVLRLLGGVDYWAYGVERLRELNAQRWILPGDDQEDLSLFEQSNVPLQAVQYLHKYLRYGGVDNYRHALEFIAAYGLGWPGTPAPPQAVPEWGQYAWGGQSLATAPGVGILFYRAHCLAGNTAVIDQLCQQLQARNLQPFPYYIHTLTNPQTRSAVQNFYQEHPIELLGVTTGFSVAQWRSEIPELALWQNLDVPVCQIIFSTDARETWSTGMRGLSPKDLGMQVALPEVDGRIITRAISFKASTPIHPDLETPIDHYQPDAERVDFMADLVHAWVRLRTTPIAERKIAIILANYPTDNGRIANGVGLDTPASCVQVWQALFQAGYRVPPPLENGDELIQILTRFRTNDPESQSRAFCESVSLQKYHQWLKTVPQYEAIVNRWGLPDRIAEQGLIPIYGQCWGNLLIGIQPSRGYDHDPSLNYHSPDLEPTHHYLAFYYWLRYEFQAHAVIHLGKHGTLEWLPGKSVALSCDCYPEIALGTLPNFYPFIVNDPGEGTQAKRRAQAVIIDHLTPPLTRAELYGSLLELETLVDEYYQAQALDPERLPWISQRLQRLIHTHHLEPELKLNHKSGEIPEIIPVLDTYLCELKESQIRGGLHILGTCPEGELLRDLLIAISRYPGANRLGLTQAIAQDWGWDFDPLDLSASETS
ncbi:cobaltochelatase, CobN subunit [Gloeomargarita lithophora Alchichica-D10]|uniref:Cobaltochelatase, CobN subunit n=1 Tax=Gloeomargarita lithophora Alchichica-D10 TaxID=1188229 RepID=A0A1J0AHB1_9CYAN|nr:cobaltochelatase subunit CobN [Gloeomargarita lithophora]APB35283.1 cobaltochelatase, CobN subunit [Gloeomargarita lithophora Alchichica-D10]